MRQDLSQPQQVVQACHAAIEAARLLPQQLAHPHLVVIGIPDERQLCRCLEHLRRVGIAHHPFHEPDRGNELTALATEPVFGQRRRLLRRYRCLGQSGFA